MKKLLVEKSELDEQTTTNIQIQLTSHHMYGLYDFNPEKMIDDLSRNYKLKQTNVNHPLFFLKDENNKEIILKLVTDDY